MSHDESVGAWRISYDVRIPAEWPLDSWSLNHFFVYFELYAVATRKLEHHRPPTTKPGMMGRGAKDAELDVPSLCFNNLHAKTPNQLRRNP